jgi:hypothetical protein
MKESMGWVDIMQGRNKWQALVNRVMKFQGP